VIILDTNIVSELMRVRANENVLHWLATYNPSQLYLTANTIMELMFGALSHPTLEGQDKLRRQINHQLRFFGKPNILPFDSAAALICAGLMQEDRARTPSRKIVDLQISAIALNHRMAVATRNTSDFQHNGLQVINPWTS
jgi:toxin FitB